jgi:hypothetical protein
MFFHFMSLLQLCICSEEKELIGVLCIDSQDSWPGDGSRLTSVVKVKYFHQIKPNCLVQTLSRLDASKLGPRSRRWRESLARNVSPVISVPVVT